MNLTPYLTMFNLNRKTDYALVALARLASDKDGEPLSARAISEEFDLPLQGLMGILKELHRAGLVDSIRGVKGGYVLSRDASSITVAEVIQTIEGPAQLAPCCDDTGDSDDGDDCLTCRLIARCPISSAIRELGGRINQYLNTVTIAQLMESETGKALPELEPFDDRESGSPTPAPVQVNVKIDR